MPGFIFAFLSVVFVVALAVVLLTHDRSHGNHIAKVGHGINVVEVPVEGSMMIRVVDVPVGGRTVKCIVTSDGVSCDWGR